MNKEHLEDILVDLEVLYNKLPPLARAHINEAQRYVQLSMKEMYPRHCLLVAANSVGLARSQLA